jgi:glycosyltransferase involved in cell wall biosynthesis
MGNNGLVNNVTSTIHAIQVVSNIVEQASGPSYTVRRQCEALIDVGENVQLVTLDWAPHSWTLPFMQEFPFGIGPRKLGNSPQMRRWLSRTVSSGQADIVHNHGLWMMTNVYAGWATRGQKCRLVVSPRGTLSERALKESARIKRVFWTLLQKPAFRHAACFHATAESELEDIRRAGFRQPVCIIPNGIDVPELPRNGVSGRKTLLYLGRIHAIKGIDILLHAWKELSDRFPEWDLRIVGSDDGGYLPQMQKLAAELGLQRMKFSGPLFNEEKWRAYNDADLFVLPSHSENFGVTVAESLAAGTPVVVTRGAPWPELESRRVGWWINIGVDPLVICLEEAMARPSDDLMVRGSRGREWMINEFSWERVATMMDQTYRWLLSDSEMPNWVHLH